MVSQKTFLFDFDGTIADTFSVALEIINDNAENYGFKKIQSIELPRLRDLSPWQFLQEFKVPLYKLPFFISRFQSELYNNIHRVQPFAGLPEVFHQLYKSGCHLGIITSNSEKNVKLFLDNNELGMFDFIHNERNLFGKSHTINKVIRQFKLEKKDVMYVGDEVRDVVASQKSGIGVVAVAWGFNSESVLKSYNPTFLVHSPQQLLDIFNTWK